MTNRCDVVLGTVTVQDAGCLLMDQKLALFVFQLLLLDLLLVCVRVLPLKLFFLLCFLQLQLFLKDIIEVLFWWILLLRLDLLFEWGLRDGIWCLTLGSHCILLLRLNIDVGGMKTAQWLWTIR